MTKTRENNIVLSADEKIQFANSQIYHDETEGLTISGSTLIDVVSVSGITIDDSNIGDGKVLQYDQASNTLRYIVRPVNGDRGIFGGGWNGISTNYDVIDFIIISSTGNAEDFGNLSQAKRALASTCNE